MIYTDLCLQRKFCSHTSERFRPLNGTSQLFGISISLAWTITVLRPHYYTKLLPIQREAISSPILKHCSPYLSDIAVFDHTHKAYLFFDKDTMRHLKNGKTLTSHLVNKSMRQGKSFTKFNSITIQCEKQESHLFLPVEVSGSRGSTDCYMLVDTGASITTVSERVASLTGYDILANSPRKSFNTANGWMSCPIVRREVNIGGVHKSIEVAVNQRDELNLLGMNYFKGMGYIVDFQNSCIYLWEK